jgi:fumarate reductase subunit C
VSYWFSRPAYARFMARELSAVFIGAYAVFLIVLMGKARDDQAFQRLLEGLKSPVSILLHLVVLGFAVYHAVTYFNITPRVLVVQRGEDRVPDHVISGAHYAAWLVASVILLVICMAAR